VKIQHNVYHPIRRYRNTLKNHARLCDVCKDVYYVSWLTTRQRTDAKKKTIQFFYENDKT